MKKNNQFTLWIAGIAIAGGAYAYFYEAKQDVKPVDSTDVTVWSLSENQAKDLNTIVVKADNQEAKYVRTGDKWHLATQPARELTSYDWDSAYKNLKDMEATRKLADKATDLGKYGLTKPAVSVQWGDDKSPYSLEVGDKTPTGDAYFVHDKKDDGLYTIASWKVDAWKKLAQNPPLAPTPAPASPAPAAKTGAAPAGGALTTKAVTGKQLPSAAPSLVVPSVLPHPIVAGTPVPGKK